MISKATGEDLKLLHEGLSQARGVGILKNWSFFELSKGELCLLADLIGDFIGIRARGFCKSWLPLHGHFDEDRVIFGFSLKILHESLSTNPRSLVKNPKP